MLEIVGPLLLILAGGSLVAFAFAGAESRAIARRDNRPGTDIVPVPRVKVFRLEEERFIPKAPRTPRPEYARPRPKAGEWIFED